VSVPEVGTYHAVHVPYVVLTSNSTRDLSAALKRRCLHLSLDYPDAERELAIIQSKDTGLPGAAARALVDVVRQIRELELRKAPSISETIDWARTLAVLGATELTADLLASTANVVVKYDRDLKRTLDALPRLIDPNATLPEPGGHGHAHGHDHDHDHGGHEHGGHEHGDHEHGGHEHGDNSDGGHSARALGPDAATPATPTTPTTPTTSATLDMPATLATLTSPGSPISTTSPASPVPSVSKRRAERSFKASSANARGARRRPV
jgi:hypothetical protein